MAALTPEEKKTQEQVEARKRRHKKQAPEEGKAGHWALLSSVQQDDFVLRPTYDAIGPELISLVAATLQEFGKPDMENSTKADETMLLPLAQKMGKISGRCASKQVRTELMEGLGNTYGFHISFHMARKKSMDDWLTRVLYYMTLFFYDKPFQKQVGVMSFLEAHE